MEHLLEYDNFLNETFMHRSLDDDLSRSFDAWNKKDPKTHIMKVINQPGRKSWNFLAHAEMNKWSVVITVYEDAKDPDVKIQITHVNGKPTEEFRLIEKLANESLFKLKGAKKLTTTDLNYRLYEIAVPLKIGNSFIGNGKAIVNFVDKSNNICRKIR